MSKSCSKKLYNETIVCILAILFMGLILNKLVHSIIFLFCYIPLKKLIGINSNDNVQIYFIKSALMFLITVLSTEIVDIKFYKNLILFYLGITMIGINILVPIYKKNNLLNNEYGKKINIIIVTSIIIFMFNIISLNTGELTKYVLYISSPSFIIYMFLIISIIKDNIVID